MKIYQIIIVSSFYRMEGGLEKGSPVIDVKNCNSFDQAKNYVITQIDKIQHKIETTMEADVKEESLRAETIFRNGITTYKMNIIENDTDPLDDFCMNEAKFRLSEYFGFTPESIPDNLLEDTAKSIRSTIDCCEYLYDTIDNNIREVLNKYEEKEKKNNA